VLFAANVAFLTIGGGLKMRETYPRTNCFSVNDDSIGFNRIKKAIALIWNR
jgi:hypothetical protein